MRDQPDAIISRMRTSITHVRVRHTMEVSNDFVWPYSDNLVFPLQPRSTPSTLKCFALRLGPGEEIKSRLQEFVKRHDLQAAFVLSCVGSVERAKIRLAHATAINSTNEVSILI